MKLQFLPDGADDCPLIRLFAFTPAEARQLSELVSQLAVGRMERVALHHAPFVQPLDDIELTLTCADRDLGIVPTGPNTFECRLTAEGWDDVAGWIEPFTTGSTGFQWLIPSRGEIAWLLSVTGQW